MNAPSAERSRTNRRRPVRVVCSNDFQYWLGRPFGRGPESRAGARQFPCTSLGKFDGVVLHGEIHSVISHQTKAARCELFLHRLHEHWAITVEQIPATLQPPPCCSSRDGTSRTGGARRKDAPKGSNSSSRAQGFIVTSALGNAAAG